MFKPVSNIGSFETCPSSSSSWAPQATRRLSHLNRSIEFVEAKPTAVALELGGGVTPRPEPRSPLSKGTLNIVY